jgi:hypothetical protein
MPPEPPVTRATRVVLFVMVIPLVSQVVSQE